MKLNMAKTQTEKSNLYWVKDNIIANNFPDIGRALKEPDGLLAIGGDLHPQRLIDAYHRGIFPWNNEGQPILWWSPDPRWVLYPNRIKISRSLRKILNNKKFEITFNRNFPTIIKMCAAPRDNCDDTWITNDILDNFNKLHQLGYAHSVECWYQGELAGGLYGIAMGKVFFGESMFSKISDASKVALVHLAKTLSALNFEIIDCQVHTTHLESLGAVALPRSTFADILHNHCQPGIKLDLPKKYTE